MKQFYQNFKDKAAARKKALTAFEQSDKFLFVKTYSASAGVSQERESSVEQYQEIEVGLPPKDSRQTSETSAVLTNKAKTSLETEDKKLVCVSHRTIEINLLFQKKIHKIQLDMYIDREHKKLFSKNGYIQSVATQELGEASIYEKIISEIYRGQKFVPDQALALYQKTEGKHNKNTSKSADISSLGQQKVAVEKEGVLSKDGLSVEQQEKLAQVDKDFYRELESNLSTPHPKIAEKAQLTPGNDLKNNTVAQIEKQLERILTEFAFSEVAASIHSPDKEIVKAALYEYVFGAQAHESTKKFMQQYKLNCLPQLR